jgi:23S rRNA (uracil1939-C5)-methyltransferase
MTETIVRLAARGDGVTASGRFVAGAVPGDTIDDGGALIPGAGRQSPACRHFGPCGGCQLQHVSAALYADFLGERVRSALEAQGLQTALRAPLVSAPHTRRRVALRATRKGRRVTLGYAEAKSHTLIDLGECPVMAPALFALLAPLRRLLGSILPERRTANIQMTLADQGVDVMIDSVAVEGLEAAEALANFGQENRLARLSIDEGFGPLARWEPDRVTVTLGGHAVALPEGAFLQATAEGEAALCRAVGEAVAGASAIADLFAGLGTFTFASGARYAAEGSRASFFALQAATRASNLPITLEHRDLFRKPVFAPELAQFDCVIIDPPRAGAKEQVAELAKSTVARIAYVSCNPATFARDARTLVDGGFTLDWIQPVGQFLWSTHVELVALFLRA